MPSSWWSKRPTRPHRAAACPRAVPLPSPIWGLAGRGSRTRAQTRPRPWQNWTSGLTRSHDFCADRHLGRRLLRRPLIRSIRDAYAATQHERSATIRALKRRTAMARENPFMTPEIAKMFEKMAVPGLDMQAFMELQRKNMEAFQLANKTMLEGVQLVLKREIEIVQHNVEEAMKNMQELMAETDPKAGMKLRVDAAKETLEKALANLKELSALSQKSNEEAFAILNKRALESFDEMKTALQPTKGGKAG
ncbi:MAG: phasin family protein [Geminicoccaceae bacterium]|nr:MAG: phasin family protein [Geminicoccaceae bacterium]